MCDGFGGGTTRDAVLAIMKDSRIGAYGAIGVGMMLALKWVTLGLTAPLGTSPHGSQRAHGQPLVRHRPDLAAPLCAQRRRRQIQTLCGQLERRRLALSGVLGTLGLLPMIWLGEPRCRAAPPATGSTGRARARPGRRRTARGAYFKTRLGGYTGDCLGAAQQLSELIFCWRALRMSWRRFQ